MNEARFIQSEHVAYPWEAVQSCFVRGYAFLNGTLYRARDLAELLNRINSLEDCLSIIDQANGSFAVVILREGLSFATVDHLRSFPLFWKKSSDGATVISDDIFHLVDDSSELDHRTLSQFLTSLHTQETDTLFTSVHQICAGYYLCITEEGITSRPYWTYQYQNQSRSLEHHIDMMLETYDATFRRCLAVLDGRQAVVPLSGGRDSRIIAFFLHKFQYQNVVTYSYGLSGNREEKIAKQVSKSLGFRHEFINYDTKEIRHFYRHGIEDFSRVSAQGCSVPCVQEFPAVHFLKVRNLVDSHAVFLPGYSGDFLAGSRISEPYTPGRTLTKDQVVSTILAKHHNQHRSGNFKHWKHIGLWDRVENHMTLGRLSDHNSLDDVLFAMEAYETIERQPKFIQNAVRAYESEGFEWMTPLFDREQFTAWATIPNALRSNRRLFKELEQKLYDIDLSQIDFAHESARPLNPFLRKIHLLFQLLFRPKTFHYLLSLYPKRRYCWRIFTSWGRNVNNYVREDTLNSIWNELKTES